MSGFVWARPAFEPSHPMAVDVLRGIHFVGELRLDNGVWSFPAPSVGIPIYRWPCGSVDDWEVEYLMERGLVRPSPAGDVITMSDQGFDYLCSISESWRRMSNAIPPMPKMTLREMCQKVRADGVDHLEAARFVAVVILGKHLGGDWINRNIIGEGASNRFLRTGPALDPQHDIRVIHLAEMIYNLHPVSGFQSVMDKVRTDNLEAAFAELETGKILTFANVDFNFVTPTMKRGSDYDLRIRFQGHEACGDTKCRLETTERNSDRLVGTINAALSQLPPDEPGIMFLKTPCTWMDHDMDLSFLDDFGRVAARVFGGCERLVLLVCYTSAAWDFGKAVAPILLLKSFASHRHKFDPAVDWAAMLDDVDAVRIDPDLIVRRAGWHDIIAECA